jgi:tripartite-type tricarboxylate transporter receptor subunit TctC
VKDFEPVSLVAFLPNVLIVDPNARRQLVAELIALLKKDPARAPSPRPARAPPRTWPARCWPT